MAFTMAFVASVQKMVAVFRRQRLISLQQVNDSFYFFRIKAALLSFLEFLVEAR